MLHGYLSLTDYSERRKAIELKEQADLERWIADTEYLLATLDEVTKEEEQGEQ